MNTNNRKNRLTWAAMGLPLLLLGACNRGPAAPKPEKKTEKTEAAVPKEEAQPIGEFTAVGRRTLEEVIPTVGTFKARQTTRISAQVGGQLKAIYVDEGDRVRSGELLAVVDGDMVKLELAQRQADAAASRARAASARENIESAKRELLLPARASPLQNRVWPASWKWWLLHGRASRRQKHSYLRLKPRSPPPPSP